MRSRHAYVINYRYSNAGPALEAVVRKSGKREAVAELIERKRRIGKTIIVGSIFTVTGDVEAMA